MSAAPKPKLTVAQYLEIENAAEFKSEFHRGEMFAMAGASREHNALKSNFEGELFGQLKGSECRSCSSDQRVSVARTGLYTYPDIIIVCGRPEGDPLDRNTLTNPRVIIEILSPSTEAYDRIAKFRNYQELASVREYVLVAQDEIRIERLVRQVDGTWILTVYNDPEGEFALDTVPVRIPLRDIYVGVEIPPPAS